MLKKSIAHFCSHALYFAIPCFLTGTGMACFSCDQNELTENCNMQADQQGAIAQSYDEQSEIAEANLENEYVREPTEHVVVMPVVQRNYEYDCKDFANQRLLDARPYVSELPFTQSFQQGKLMMAPAQLGLSCFDSICESSTRWNTRLRMEDCCALKEEPSALSTYVCLFKDITLPEFTPISFDSSLICRGLLSLSISLPPAPKLKFGGYQSLPPILKFGGCQSLTRKPLLGDLTSNVKLSTIGDKLSKKKVQKRTRQTGITKNTSRSSQRKRNANFSFRR
ncbi:MAG: hypothetical protein LBQ43_01490 [Holosporales bacterium]|jgi:hypothetical protein|nr:hypothetical protein [Holosporales bacterium]